MSDAYEISTRDYVEYVEQVVSDESITIETAMGLKEELSYRVETIKSNLEYIERSDESFKPSVHAMGYLRGTVARVDAKIKHLKEMVKINQENQRIEEKRIQREEHNRQIEEARKYKAARNQTQINRDQALVSSLRSEIGESRFLEIAEQVNLNHPM